MDTIEFYMDELRERADFGWFMSCIVELLHSNINTKYTPRSCKAIR
ncbi:MAG: hypothetical protein HOO86_00035 [Bacteroidales bacterium]|nr:hypothetical protein [Bacteroidales bacterium]